MFFEQKCIMFMMVNKLYLKQLQTNQREELTDWRKSKMEIHCIKPQFFLDLEMNSNNFIYFRKQKTDFKTRRDALLGCLKG